MPPDSTAKRRRKRARKDRNREERTGLLRSEPDSVRRRKGFAGKARRGDEAEVDLEFDDVALPVAPESAND